MYVIAPHEHTATESSPRCAIQPRDRVLIVGIRLPHQGKEFLQAAKATTIAGNPFARYAPHLQPRPGNQPCQSKSAYGGGEPVGILTRRTVQYLAARAFELEGQHMMAKAPRAMVVLAMHVIGDGSSHGHQRRSEEHTSELQ